MDRLRGKPGDRFVCGLHVERTQHVGHSRTIRYQGDLVVLDVVGGRLCAPVEQAGRVGPPGRLGRRNLTRRDTGPLDRDDPFSVQGHRR